MAIRCADVARMSQGCLRSDFATSRKNSHAKTGMPFADEMRHAAEAPQETRMETTTFIKPKFQIAAVPQTGALLVQVKAETTAAKSTKPLPSRR